MPAPRQPEGFDEHNQNGRKWSQLPDPEQLVFQPKFFAQLALACFPEVGSPADADMTATADAEEKATPEEIAESLPIFQRLVNLNKVEAHLKNGSLGKSITKSIAVIESKGREEIGKVASQVRINCTQLRSFHFL